MSEQVTKYDIPNGATNVVIFVHGFGVRWDSRGMFTEIQKSLAKSWGCVLFDFYKVEGSDIYITDIDYQVEHLKNIINTVKNKYPETHINIIAHSKGCIITALAKPKITGKVILLAPPETFGTKIESYFRRYPGAKSNNKELIIPRKDGTISHIPSTFFEQAAKIDAEAVIRNYANDQFINLLQTTEDEVIGKTEYGRLQNIPNIKINQLATDHNFTGSNRDELINYISNTLLASNAS